MGGLFPPLCTRHDQVISYILGLLPNRAYEYQYIKPPWLTPRLLTNAQRLAPEDALVRQV